MTMTQLSNGTVATDLHAHADNPQPIAPLRDWSRART